MLVKHRLIGLGLTAILWLLLTPAAKAQQQQADTAVLLSPYFQEVSLDSFFRYINSTTGFKGNFSPSLTQELISYRQHNVPLYKMLDTVLSELGLGYSFRGIFIRLYSDPERKQRFTKVDTLTGKVIDENGNPLGGVSVSDSASKRYVITSYKGIFKLPWPPGSSWVEFTHIGREKKTIRISNANTFTTIELKPSFSAKEDILILGYYDNTRYNTTASTVQLKRKDFTQGSFNIARELTGKVPGLLVAESSGAPGAASRMQIRGRQSIGVTPGVDNQPRNDPMVLLNKVPLLGGNRPVTRLPSAAGDPQGGGISGGGISTLAMINMEDVMSIHVLKDADATAIYGARGAHGVIHITTRQGAKMDKPSFGFNVQSGAVMSAYVPQLMDNKEYTAMRKEALATANQPLNARYAPDLVSLDTNNYINVPKLLAGGTGWLYNINAFIRGGGSLLQYYISAGYYRESSVMPASLPQQRFTTHANIRYGSPGSRLEAAISFYYGLLTYRSTPTDPLLYSARVVPLLPALRNDSGALVWEHKGFRFMNPLGQFDNYSNTRINSFTGSLQTGYRLWKHLYFRSTLAWQWLPVAEELKLYMAAGNPEPQKATAQNQFLSIMAEPRLEYEHTIGDWRWGALLGATFQQEKNGWRTDWHAGYSNDTQLDQPGVQAQTITDGNNTRYRYHATYGRFHTDWRDRYFLNATGRFDRSSRFGQWRKMAFFGALGAAWVFSEEKWLNAWKGLTYGKLRGSYGTAGNDQIEDFGFVDVYTIQSGPLSYGGAEGLQLIRQANPPLTWEKNRKLEIALEVETGRKLFVSAAWYRNITSNQLITVNPSAMTGLTRPIVINAPASVLNTGWEFTLRSTLRLGATNSFSNTLVLTLPRNRLQAFPGLAASSYHTSLIVGQPLSVQRGFWYKEVDPQTGLFTKPNPVDTAIIGHWEPQALAGWTQEWRLGNWRIVLFIDARKQQALDPRYYSYSTGNMPGRWSPGQLTNHPRTVWQQRWQHPGDQALLQRFTAASITPAMQQSLEYFRQSGNMMADASFWRIRSLYLSWEWPEYWQKRMKVGDARIYLQAQSLYMGTKYKDGDPSLQFPLRLSSQRTITAGIQMNF